MGAEQPPVPSRTLSYLAAGAVAVAPPPPVHRLAVTAQPSSFLWVIEWFSTVTRVLDFEVLLKSHFFRSGLAKERMVRLTREDVGRAWVNLQDGPRKLIKWAYFKATPSELKLFFKLDYCIHETAYNFIIKKEKRKKKCYF